MTKPQAIMDLEWMRISQRVTRVDEHVTPDLETHAIYQLFPSSNIEYRLN